MISQLCSVGNQEEEQPHVHGEYTSSTVPLQLHHETADRLHGTPPGGQKLRLQTLFPIEFSTMLPKTFVRSFVEERRIGDRAD